MKFEFRDNSLVLIPETPPEKEGVTKLYPKGTATGTRKIRVKEFVDRFGSGTGDFFIELHGSKCTIKKGTPHEV